MISSKAVDYIYSNIEALEGDLQAAIDEYQSAVDQLKAKQFLINQIRHLLDNGESSQALELFLTGLYDG